MNDREGYTQTQKKAMTLSQETIQGIRITGLCYTYMTFEMAWLFFS